MLRRISTIAIWMLLAQFAAAADAPPAVKKDAPAAKQQAAAPAVKKETPAPKKDAPAPKKEAPTVKKPEPAKPAAKTPAKPTVPQVSFSKQVAPILLKNCAGCHGATEPKGEYQLHTFALATKAGESGLAAITPGKLDDSELFRLVSSTDASERMPKDGDPLPADQIALVKRWIEQGGKFDGPDKQAPLASLVPRKIHPAPPESYRVPIAVTALAFRPDGKELAASGYHEITIWDPATGKLLRRIKNVEERVYGLAYNGDGTSLAAAGGTPGQSGEISLYDPAKAVLVKTLATTNDVAFDVAFDPKGKKLAAAAADRTIRIFDLAKGIEERVIEDHADWVMGIAFSPDGTQLASASRDKTSKVFELKTGDSLATYPGHETVYGVAFTADGKQVISCGGDKKIHFWNPADGKQAAVIAGIGGEVFQVISAAGKILACSSDRTAREYKAADRALVHTFSGHKDYVYALAFNEPTKRLATGSFDGEIRIWDIDSGKQVLAFGASPGFPPTSTAQAKK
jgi:hypothetical protein